MHPQLYGPVIKDHKMIVLAAEARRAQNNQAQGHNLNTLLGVEVTAITYQPRSSLSKRFSSKETS
jgi:hypothetical protein